MLLAQLSVMEEKNCGLRSKLLSSYLLTSSMISRASMLLAIKWYLADRFLFRTMEVSIGRVARLRKKKTNQQHNKKEKTEYNGGCAGASFFGKWIGKDGLVAAGLLLRHTLSDSSYRSWEGPSIC